MEMLRAATLNIATAYGKDKELGTLEPGKIADLLVLDRNPLESAANYRSIHMILKDGTIVDRDSLPTQAILTAPMEPPFEEEASYILALKGTGLPICPMCIPR
jgi:adenine deaminase